MFIDVKGGNKSLFLRKRKLQNIMHKKYNSFCKKQQKHMHT